MDTPYQPVTPADMNIVTQPFTISRPIIVDGKIDMLLLQEIGKDLDWLKLKVTPVHKNIQDVALATINDNEDVRFYSNQDSQFTQ